MQKDHNNLLTIITPEYFKIVINCLCISKKFHRPHFPNKDPKYLKSYHS